VSVTFADLILYFLDAARFISQHTLIGKAFYISTGRVFQKKTLMEEVKPAFWRRMIFNIECKTNGL